MGRNHHQEVGNQIGNRWGARRSGVSIIGGLLLAHGLLTVSSIVLLGFGATMTQLSVGSWLLGVAILVWGAFYG